MLLGKRPRPAVIRRTRSMSGGMAVDTQATEEEVMMSDSLQPHHEEEDPIKDPPHPVVMMATTHDGILVADHQTKNVFGALEGECLVGTVMFPSSPTTTTTTTTTITNHIQNQTTNSVAHAVIHTPHFLRTCGLCKSRLAPARDIYMYRGDTAFCSLECREQQMKQDQKKEKWKVAASSSNKQDHHRVSPPTAATVKAASTKSQTAACT